MGEEEEGEDKLISPCRCAGTTKYIHSNCLKEWLNSKRVTRELKYSTIYVFKVASCELCKHNYPGKLNYFNNFRLCN